MKKLISILIIFASISLLTTINAQSISSLAPTHVIWAADGQQVTLKNGSYGIAKHDSLSLKIYFRKEYIKKFDEEKLNFEVKWYYFFSTRKQIIESKVVKYNANHFQTDNSYLISSTKGNLTKGWWEVQIVSGTDNGLIEFGNIYKFQILIK